MDQFDWIVGIYLNHIGFNHDQLVPLLKLERGAFSCWIWEGERTIYGWYLQNPGPRLEKWQRKPLLLCGLDWNNLRQKKSAGRILWKGKWVEIVSYWMTKRGLRWGLHVSQAGERDRAPVQNMTGRQIACLRWCKNFPTEEKAGDQGVLSPIPQQHSQKIYIWAK